MDKINVEEQFKKFVEAIPPEDRMDLHDVIGNFAEWYIEDNDGDYDNVVAFLISNWTEEQYLNY